MKSFFHLLLLTVLSVVYGEVTPLWNMYKWGPNVQAWCRFPCFDKIPAGTIFKVSFSGPTKDFTTFGNLRLLNADQTSYIVESNYDIWSWGDGQFCQFQFGLIYEGIQMQGNCSYHTSMPNIPSQSSFPYSNISEPSIQQSNIPQLSIQEFNSAQPNIQQSNIPQLGIQKLNSAQWNVKQSSAPQLGIQKLNSAQWNVKQSIAPQLGIQKLNSAQSNIQQSSIPQMSTQELNSAQSTIKQSNIPQMSIQKLNSAQSSIPQLSIQELNSAQSNIQQTSSPQPSILQSRLAQSSISQSRLPQMSILELNIPQSNIKQSSASQTNILQSSVQSQYAPRIYEPRDLTAQLSTGIDLATWDNTLRPKTGMWRYQGRCTVYCMGTYEPGALVIRMMVDKDTTNFNGFGAFDTYTPSNNYSRTWTVINKKRVRSKYGLCEFDFEIDHLNESPIPKGSCYTV